MKRGKRRGGSGGAPHESWAGSPAWLELQARSLWGVPLPRIPTQFVWEPILVPAVPRRADRTLLPRLQPAFPAVVLDPSVPPRQVAETVWFFERDVRGYRVALACDLAWGRCRLLSWTARPSWSDLWRGLPAEEMFEAVRHYVLHSHYAEATVRVLRIPDEVDAKVESMHQSRWQGV